MRRRTGATTPHDYDLSLTRYGYTCIQYTLYEDGSHYTYQPASVPGVRCYALNECNPSAGTSRNHQIRRRTRSPPSM